MRHKAILRAVGSNAIVTLPFVRPGAKSLLRLSGWPKVERTLQEIDAVEALGIEPADAPEHWQHIHGRLSVNEEPRLTRARTRSPAPSERKSAP